MAPGSWLRRDKIEIESPRCESRGSSTKCDDPRTDTDRGGWVELGFGTMGEEVASG